MKAPTQFDARWQTLSKLTHLLLESDSMGKSDTAVVAKRELEEIFARIEKSLSRIEKQQPIDVESRDAYWMFNDVLWVYRQVSKHRGSKELCSELIESRKYKSRLQGTLFSKIETVTDRLGMGQRKGLLLRQRKSPNLVGQRKLHWKKLASCFC